MGAWGGTNAQEGAESSLGKAADPKVGAKTPRDHFWGLPQKISLSFALQRKLCLAPPIHGWEMSCLHPSHFGEGARHLSTSFCSCVGTEPRGSAGPKPESPRASMGLGCSGQMEPITRRTEWRRAHPRLMRNNAGSVQRGGQWKGKRGETQPPAVPALSRGAQAEGRDSAAGTGMPRLCRDRVLLGEVDVHGGARMACPRPPASRLRALPSPSQSPPTSRSLRSGVPSIDPAAGSGAAPLPAPLPALSASQSWGASAVPL